MGERTTVIGTILAVVFQNEENGYTVARIVTDDGEPVTVVGCIPCAAPGEELILTGRYTTHPQHGEQFAADEVERHMPTGETEILNYLASGVVRGIGPATAQKLVDRFGDEPLCVANLVAVAYLKAMCEKLGIDRVNQADGRIDMRFALNAQVDGQKLFTALNGFDKRLTLNAAPPVTLTLRDQTLNREDLLMLCVKVMERLLARMELSAA